LLLLYVWFYILTVIYHRKAVNNTKLLFSKTFQRKQCRARSGIAEQVCNSEQNILLFRWPYIQARQILTSYSKLLEKLQTGSLKSFFSRDKAIYQRWLPEWIGVQRYGYLTIRYVSRYRGHDMIRIAIHF
jgi:hypothetical protein